MEKIQENDKHDEFLTKLNKWLYQTNTKYLKLFKNNEGSYAPMSPAWKNPYNLKDVYNDTNIAIVVDHGYVVLDVDDKQRTGKAERFLKIVKDYGWLCNILKTDSGYHFWFKSDVSYTNKVNAPLPIGINSDIKSFGKKSMLTIKKEGVFRPWIQIVDTLDYLPKELTPFSNSNIEKKYGEVPNPYNLNQGSRRDNLFKRVAYLRKSGWNDKETKNVLHAINKFFFSSPISESEINSTLKYTNASDKSLNSLKTFYTDTGQRDYTTIAYALIESLKLVYYSGNLYFYQDDIYINDDLEIKKQIRTFCQNYKIDPITRNLVREILDAIKESNRIIKKTPNKNYVALLNGLLNLETLEVEPFNHDIFVINKLDVAYDPYAEEKVVESFLKDITENKKDLQRILMEFWGYCLSPYIDPGYGKSLILYGPTASNGKSTFLKVMGKFFGRQNYSALSLDKLLEKFGLVGLLGRMINISAEINASSFSKVGDFKSIITGDDIQVERKGEQHFTMYPTTKLIFATNDMPQITERGDGLYRRLLIVPFNNKFDASNRDIDMYNKLTTSKSLSTFLNIALDGLNNLRKNKDFTNSDFTKHVLNDFKQKNSSVISFICNYEKDIKNPDGEYFNKTTLGAIYRNFRDFCSSNGYGTLKMAKFKDEFLEFYETKTNVSLERGLISSEEDYYYDETIYIKEKQE